MRKISVIESAEELVDLFMNHRGEYRYFLEVGSIQNSWINLDDGDFQVSSQITFEQLFLELCRRTGVSVKRVGSAKRTD